MNIIRKYGIHIALSFMWLLLIDGSVKLHHEHHELELLRAVVIQDHQNIGTQIEIDREIEKELTRMKRKVKR